jgi:hypothetical protein
METLHVSAIQPVISIECKRDYLSAEIARSLSLLLDLG